MNTEVYKVITTCVAYKIFRKGISKYKNVFHKYSFEYWSVYVLTNTAHMQIIEYVTVTQSL